MEKYGFVYVWRDKKRNRYYIGCHWGREDDGYICSSKWMRDAYRYRPEDFKRRVTARVYSNRNDLLVEEHRWLSMIKDEEIGKRYYNATKHHNGHWFADEVKLQWMRERNSGENNPMYGKSGRVGMKHTDEAKSKIGAKSRGNTNRRGAVLSEETKRKISDGKKANPHDQSGAKNPAYGKQWITNGVHSMQIMKGTDVPEGYRVGRIINHHRNNV